jgi:hypothetical protein
MIDARALAIASALTLAMGVQSARADCTISDESKQLDPVEVGFCESDAVFVGKVESRLETIRAYTEEGSGKTKHYRIESSTLRVDESYKGKLPAKVTLIADLYDKKSGAFSFVNGEEYVVFAKRLPTGNEYAGASAACSVQPTVLLAEAKLVRERLEQHRKNGKKIDCKNIQPKAGG